MRKKKDKKDERKEREKGNGLFVYPRQESYIWKSEKRPDTWKAGFLESKKAILFRKSGDEKHNATKNP